MTSKCNMIFYGSMGGYIFIKLPSSRVNRLIEKNLNLMITRKPSKCSVLQNPEWRLLWSRRIIYPEVNLDAGPCGGNTSEGFLVPGGSSCCWNAAKLHVQSEMTDLSLQGFTSRVLDSERRVPATVFIRRVSSEEMQHRSCEHT